MNLHLNFDRVKVGKWRSVIDMKGFKPHTTRVDQLIIFNDFCSSIYMYKAEMESFDRFVARNSWLVQMWSVQTSSAMVTSYL